MVENEEVNEEEIRFIECPNPAYKRIVNSGIEKMLNGKTKDKLSDIEDISYNTIFTEKGEAIINKAEKFLSQPLAKRKITEKSALYNDILQLKQIIEEDEFLMRDAKRRLLIKHPGFLAYLALGEELFNFKNYGFPSIRSLEESVASFCIGEIMGRERFSTIYWRSGNYKNEVNQNVHGDLYASQKDVSGKDRKENTLFGKEDVFDTVKLNPEIGSISAYQDWSAFLLSILRYAQEIGKEKMPEIINWRDVLKKVGVRGTNTAEGEFGMGSDMHVKLLMKYPVLNERIKEFRGFPLAVGGQFAGVSIPYLKDNKLIYYAEVSRIEEWRKKESFDFGSRMGRLSTGKFYIKEIEYSEEDIPYLLKANYRLFARSRKYMTDIMDRFIKEVS